MAESRSTVELVFQGIDRTGEATQAALRNAERFSGGLQSATAPLADFTKNALAVEAGLLAAGAAITAFSIKVASDFQSAATDLNRVLGETENIEDFKDLAREISGEYGIAATDVLASIANFKQAGFTAEEAAILVRDSLDLMISGNLDASEASQQLVASLKGLGLEATDARIAIDLINSVSNQYAATAGQLAEGLSTLSPVARTAGLSLQETIAVLTPGIEVFQSGSEVANALRTVFLNLISDTDRVTSSLDDLGISQTDVNGELRSARDIFFEVATEVANLDENQQLLFANQLVGKQRTAEFLAVVNGLPTVLNIAGQSFEFAGSAAAEAAQQLGTVESQVARVKTSFDNLLLNIGEPLLDSFGDVATALTAVFNAVGAELDQGQIAELIDFIDEQLSAAAEALNTAAGNIPEAFELADLSGFQTGIEAVIGAVRELFRTFDLDTPDGLANVIEGLAEAFQILSEFSGGAISSLQLIFDAIGEGSGELTEFAKKWADTLGQLGGFATQINAILPGVDALIGGIGALASVLFLNQSASLLSAIRANSAGLGRFAVALGPAGAVAAAAGFLILKLKQIADGLDILAEQERLTEEANREFAIGLATTADRLERISERTGIAVESAADLRREVAAGNIEFEELTGLWVRAGDALVDFSDKTIDTEGNLAELKLRIGEIEEQRGIDVLVGSVDDLSDSAERAGESARGASEKTKEWVESSEGGIRAFTGIGGVVSQTAEQINTDILDLSNTSEEFRLKLREIASDEYIARIEGQFEFDIAKLEAETQRIEAAFSSINTSIESTGELLGDLFNVFSDTSGLDQLFIQRQIEREQERRDQAFEQQQELTQAQIDALRERTRQLQQGNALIEVDGAGLQPHLEAFMFEILRSIQLRVNEDGLDMLLGVEG